MTGIERFDPFNDRLCRNVRNALSESLPEVLEEKDLQPARRIAVFFLDGDPPDIVTVYIDRRLSAYQTLLDDVLRRHPRTPIGVAMLVWKHGLFFETHEYLEPYWMAASGADKALLQALIRAAGAYVHLEQGNLKAARRIADKAIPVLETYRDLLGEYTNPDRLVDRLRRLDPEPPVPSPG